MSKDRLVPVVLFFSIFSAVALAACGSGESDEEQITTTIEKAATSTDPADCTKFTTVAFMEQRGGKEGEAAVKECEEQASEGNKPESVDVEEVEIEGEEATATAAFVGSSFDGQTLVLNLVKEEGDWKVNAIKGFKKLDREKLIVAFGKEMKEGGAPPRLRECVIESVEGTSDAELEHLILSGPQGFGELFEKCSQ